MSLTNAEHHQQSERKGVWRSAHGLRCCTNYFGRLAVCRRAIMPGKKYFDTQENIPDAGVRHNFIVCDHCANAPHRADFLVGRSERTAA
jgi:hypothetical protein